MCNKTFPKFNNLKQQAYIIAYEFSSQLGGSALAELTHASGSALLIQVGVSRKFRKQLNISQSRMASTGKLNPPHQAFHSPARQPELAQTVMPWLQESGGTQELARSLCSEMAHYYFCHLPLASPASQGGEMDSSSQWESLPCHIAKCMEMRKDELWPFLQSICHIAIAFFLVIPSFLLFFPFFLFRGNKIKVHKLYGTYNAYHDFFN